MLPQISAFQRNLGKKWIYLADNVCFAKKEAKNKKALMHVFVYLFYS